MNKQQTDPKQHPDYLTSGVRVGCRRYSRVVGYWSAVEDWNEGKKEEFKDRVTYRTTGETPINAPRP